MVFSDLRSNKHVSELFDVISKKVGDRPGGYTRVVKLGNRLGDNADMALIELVDFNDIYSVDNQKKKSTRRRRSKNKDQDSIKNEKPNSKLYFTNSYLPSGGFKLK